VDDLTNIVFAYMEIVTDPTLAGLNLTLIQHYNKPFKQIDVHSRLTILLRLYEEKEEYEKCHQITQMLETYENKSTKNI